jgi:hypothetical protein
MTGLNYFPGLSIGFFQFVWMSLELLCYAVCSISSSTPATPTRCRMGVDSAYDLLWNYSRVEIKPFGCNKSISIESRAQISRIVRQNRIQKRPLNTFTLPATVPFATPSYHEPHRLRCDRWAVSVEVSIIFLIFSGEGRLSRCNSRRLTIWPSGSPYIVQLDLK